MKNHYPWSIIGILGVCFLFLAVFSLPLAAYSPPPGVLSPEEVDLEGRTVTIVSHTDPSSTFEVGELRASRLEEAEQLFNIEVEFVSVSESAFLETVMSRIMAGDADYDIIKSKHDTGYFPLAVQGAFYPVDELLPAEYFDYLAPLDQVAYEVLEFRGRQYSFGYGPGQGWRVGATRYSMYNVDLLEREGLPDIYELYLEDDWTWERASEIASATTADTTGDGEINQWGMTRISPFHTIALTMTNDTNVHRIDENGSYIFALNEPAALETLRQVNEWQNVEGVTGGGRDDFVAGNVAILLDDSMWAQRFPKADMEEKWMAVPMPMGPNSDQYRYPNRALRHNNVTATVEQPKELIALHEFLWRRDDEKETPVSWYDRYFETREQVAMMERSWQEWGGETHLFHGTELTNAIVYPAVDKVISGEVGASTAMDEIAPEAQSWLDEYFDQ